MIDLYLKFWDWFYKVEQLGDFPMHGFYIGLTVFFVCFSYAAFNWNRKDQFGFMVCGVFGGIVTSIGFPIILAGAVIFGALKLYHFALSCLGDKYFEKRRKKFELAKEIERQWREAGLL